MADGASLRQSLVAALGTFERIAAPRPDLKAAAVALCVVEIDAVPSLVLTRRSSQLRRHPGQWALPGGRIDPGESIEDAACRELLEETGFEASRSAVLGLLDDYVTRSGFVMSPVVIWGGPTRHQFDGGSATEVARVHVIPLGDLDVEPRFIAIPESDRPVIQLPMLGRVVHAPTGAILHQFVELALHGRTTRVAHFEQPVFAWK